MATLQERADAAQAPDHEANLVLIQFGRKKATEEQPGLSLRFIAPLSEAAVTPGNEFDPKEPEHGLLKLTSRNLFDGVRSLVMTGKLKRKFVRGGKESTAHQEWAFRAQNFPDDKGWEFLTSLARVAGDDDQAMVEAEFRVRAEKDDDEPKGPALFESPEPELDENDKELLNANVVPESTADHMVKAARKKREKAA